MSEFQGFGRSVDAIGTHELDRVRGRRNQVYAVITIGLAMFACGIPQSVLGQIVAATYQFRLQHGQGTSVCDAFLERLKTTEFIYPPYCGIPESDSVPGFTKLHTVPLSEHEIVELYPKVSSFTSMQNQELVPPRASPQEIRAEYDARELSAWKYSPEISVENNGKPDNVIVWQGAGISLNPSLAQCGETFRVIDPPDGVRTPQIAFVLTPDDSAIDEPRTTELFGDAGKPAPYIQVYRMDGVALFGPLGYEMGFIEYKGTYYSYAFDGVQLDQRSNSRIGSGPGGVRAEAQLRNTLSLYVRHESGIKEVCTYRVVVYLEKRGQYEAAPFS